MVQKSKVSLLYLTVIYAVGNFSSKILSFLLIFFTTFYLSKDEVGYLDLLLITTNIIIPLFFLQFSDSIFRWLLDSESEYSNDVLISTSLSFIFVCQFVFILIAGGLYSLTEFISGYYYLLIPLIITQVSYSSFQQIVRGLGDNKFYAIIGVLTSLVTVFLSIIFLKFTQYKLEGMIYSIVIAQLFSCFLMSYKMRFHTYFSVKNFDISLLKSMLNYSIPLIPNSLSWWGVSSANRFLIVLFLGASANGLFSISLKIPTIITLVISVFGLAWQEKSIQSFNDEGRNKYYSEVFNKFFKIILSISILVLSFNKLIFSYLVADSFYESLKYTPILILATLFSSFSTFYSAGFLGAKKTKQLFYSTLFSAVISLVTSYFLIPQFQLYGAALGVLIGYIALFVFRVFQSREIFVVSFHTKNILMCSFMLIFSSIPTFVENKIIEILVILSSLIFVSILNKDIISNLIKNK